jgi:hypothetical protein
MNEHEIREEIQIIRSMIDKTKRATAESATLFIVWGVLISLALIGNFILSHLKLYEWEWLNWGGITVIGWIYSVLYGIRRQRTAPVRTYVQNAGRHLYFACGAGFLLVGLVLPAIGVYSYEAITVLISAVTGILFFVMSGIFEWPFLKAIGLGWWAGAVAMSFFGAEARTLIYTFLFIVGYLIPVVLLQAKFRRERREA